MCRISLLLFGFVDDFHIPHISGLTNGVGQGPVKLLLQVLILIAFGDDDLVDSH